jgi:HK97 gp10 family phage protein
MSELTITKNGDPIAGSVSGNHKALLSKAIQVTSQAKALANFSKGYATGQTKNGIMYKVSKPDARFKTGISKKKGGFNDSPGEPAENELTIDAGVNQAVVGVNNDHAMYVEYGTRYMAPQPFLRPAALDLGTEDIKRFCKDEMTKWLKRGKKKEKTTV